MEVLTRQKSQVDLEHGWLNIDPGETKNREGRKFPLTPGLRLREIVEAELKWSRAIEVKLETIIPWLWHDEKGQPITYDRFYRTWRPVVPANRIAHDLRRTAARELNRAHVPNNTAMQMMGHKTESIYRRYAIVDEAALQDAAKLLAARQAEPGNGKKAARTVVSMEKRAKAIRHPRTGKKTGNCSRAESTKHA